MKIDRHGGYVIPRNKLVSVLIVFPIVFWGCTASLLCQYNPLAPKIPTPRVEVLSIHDTVDGRPWHERMGIPSTMQPLWGVGHWATKNLQDDLHQILLNEIRRSGIAEHVSSPLEDSIWSAKIEVMTLSVKDELQWWSDPVPIYLLGSVFGIPMRQIRGECLLRCRLLKDGKVIMDEEYLGTRRPRLCSEYLLRRSRTKAACGALANATAKMILRLDRQLASYEALEEVDRL